MTDRNSRTSSHLFLTSTSGSRPKARGAEEQWVGIYMPMITMIVIMGQVELPRVHAVLGTTTQLFFCNAMRPYRSGPSPTTRHYVYMDNVWPSSFVLRRLEIQLV